MKSRSQIALVLSVACALVVLLLFWGGALEFLELKSLDLRFRYLSQQEPASGNHSQQRPSRDVVLVAIDENSLRELKAHRITWKWPRDIYAAVVEYLHRGGAKVIVLDMLFSEPDIDRLSTDAEQTDGALAAAMKKAGNVVIAAQFRNEENLLVDDNIIVRPPDLSVHLTSEEYPFEIYSSAMLPIPLFQQSARLIGAVNYHDDGDGIFRRIHLLYRYSDATFPQLGLAAYLVGNNLRELEWDVHRGLRVRDLLVPLDADGRYLIAWYGSGGPEGAFQYYSFAALLSSALSEERNQPPLIPSSAFQGKYVIIGSNAAGLHDIKKTPTSPDGSYPGMEIHATILGNLLDRSFIQHAPAWIAVVATVVLTFFITFSFVVVRSAGWIIVIALVGVAAWTGVVAYAFQSHRLVVDYVAPTAAIVAAVSLSAIVNYQLEGKSKRQLRAIFERYVSPVVVQEIVAQRQNIALGGQELTCTAFFSDIQDFTRISERLSPAELVQFLNSYFSVETEIILKYGGLLDKYLGDAVMAVFGAPLPTTNHASQACRAALDVQRALRESSVRYDGQMQSIVTRIGVSTGPMIVGHIGSPHRVDYTAIGDTVNVAARLESANRLFGTRILISEATTQSLHGEFLLRPLGRIRVKGKDQPTPVYELLETRDQCTAEQLQLVRNFSEALECYLSGRFKQAVEAFQAILSEHPNDGPTTVYLQSSAAYLQQPPPDDWDGTVILATK